ncbi:MAG: type III-A CRISPR-associated RAMP protein Csm5 [Candidatus Firestonebacteria bacterium]|nr:type III-A CRISPR-associated RAMP protein Csm5 [Candidatus Firestonebacteria bacterium]
MQKYKFHCEILSPIHIGAGSEIDPLDYMIENKKLFKISFEKLVINMNDIKRNEFEKIIDKNNLIEIRKFILKIINKEKDSIYSIDVSSEIETLYKSKIDNIQNQLLIYPFIRTEGETTPFIPGSSIKGAIRTAIISEFAKKSNLPKPKDIREEYEFESQVINYKDAKNDPFRGIKIRDSYPQKDFTIVRDIKNFSRKRGVNNIQIICEVSHSFITGKDIEFETEIYFDESLFLTNYLGKKLNIENIIISCKNFYKDKIESEHKKFYQNNDIEKKSTQLLNIPLDDKSFLLRLGRFSGVESVTLDKYRNPRPPGNKTIWGTSRNLIEGIYPMGWMKVTIK